MKSANRLLTRPALGGLVSALAVLALAGQVARATPFASCITNNANTIYFYLNESGGNVTITYEDGSTNANYNPVYLGTGVNLSTNGNPYSFSLAGHTAYSISAYKLGSGTPSIITTISRAACRGVAANTRGASPYFGYVYSAIGAAGVLMQHSDGSGSLGGSLAPPIATGDAWGTTYAASECSISVAPDDYVLVSDFMGNTVEADGPGWEGGIIRVDPTFTSANLLLSGLYSLDSPATLPQNHGDAESRAILTDTMDNNPVVRATDFFQSLICAVFCCLV